jgi:hypothetical protein
VTPLALLPEAPVPISRASILLAWTIPVGILAQAALAGQAWFVTPALFGLHGGLGHGVLLLAALTAVMSWFVAAGRGTAVLASLVVAGLVAQTGLGYAGHRTGLALASSVHVPLGVTLFGASLAVALLLTLRAATAPAVDPAGAEG